MSPRGPQRGGLVRPFTPEQETQARPGRHVENATLVHADETEPRKDLDSSAHRVMDMCLPGVLSVAEVSAHLLLPAPVVRRIVARLQDSKHVVLSDPLPDEELHHPDFLKRVLCGLRNL